MRTRQVTFMNDYKAPDQKHNIKLNFKKDFLAIHITTHGTYFGFQQMSLHPYIISDE